jgi:hypothetical protein
MMPGQPGQQVAGQPNEAQQVSGSSNMEQGGDETSAQMERLQGILQSPEFQQLPPEEQKAIIQQGRQIIKATQQ